MNNKSDSFEHFELISAYLDGEVTQEERAFIEENPDLVKEVEKLKEMQKILSSPLSIDPILQEKHLAKALSSFPEGGKVIPFRQQKLVQRGALLAVAAAAAAFILLPVINSQNNEPDSESDLATGFVENSNSVSPSTQNADTQEPADAPAISESAQETGTTTETSRNSQASQNNEPDAEETTDSSAPSVEAEDQTPEDETVGEIEEEAMEVTQDENEEEAQLLTTSEEPARELSSRVFEEESETVNSLLETANNIWEMNRDIFSIPLEPSQIESFFSENADFFTCWIDEPFFDTSIRTPLFLQQLLINSIPSVVLISEYLQSELGPVLSVYQVDSSCLVFFEGPISGEIPSE